MLPPDPFDTPAAEAWLARGLARMATIANADQAARSFTSVTPDPSPSRLGPLGDPLFRRTVLATYLADLASYPAPGDQVSFERLAYAMASFPHGFRTYWAELDDERWPVGYAAWHPMQARAFDDFVERPATLRDRRVVPAPLATDARPYVYLFNYSVAPAFRGTALSSALVKRLAADLEAVRPAGLAAIVVSDEGRAVAERFGLCETGMLPHDGAIERVYAGRFA
jgi:hypothetical protein